MERRAYVLEPGAGESVWTLGGRFTIKLSGPVAGGHVSLIETLATRAAEPPLHIHHREDEAWYILDGQMTFHVDGQVVTARTGSFVFAPRGLPHAFTVDVEPTRVLLVALPAGFERFVVELGVPADSDEPPAGLTMPGPEVLGPVAERYGIEIVGPPIRLRG
ncbi:MAG TPA: quercetin 2,3-dioxygenase [Candidatus Limnocylindrales bacterium]|nr:quercetin 2,3-dioxygenase [Candidatus Limnocylindrales bacterium]